MNNVDIKFLEQLVSDCNSSITIPILKRVPHHVVDVIIKKVSTKHEAVLMDFLITNTKLKSLVISNEEIDNVINGIGMFTLTHDVSININDNITYIDIDPTKIVQQLNIFINAIILENNKIELGVYGGFLSNDIWDTRVSSLVKSIEFFSRQDYAIANFRSFITRGEVVNRASRTNDEFFVSIGNANGINHGNIILNNRNNNCHDGKDAIYINNEALYYVDTLDINFDYKNAITHNISFVLYCTIIDQLHGLIKHIIDIGQPDVMDICTVSSSNHTADVKVILSRSMSKLLDYLCELMNIFSISMDMDDLTSKACLKSNSLLGISSSSC